MRKQYAKLTTATRMLGEAEREDGAAREIFRVIMLSTAAHEIGSRMKLPANSDDEAISPGEDRTQENATRTASKIAILREAADKIFTETEQSGFHTMMQQRK